MSEIQCLIPIDFDSGFTRDFKTAQNVSDKGLVCQPSSGCHSVSQWSFQVPPGSTFTCDTFYLNDDLCKWLEAQKLERTDVKLHWYSTNKAWILSVPYDIAMLFKLTWGGM